MSLVKKAKVSDYRIVNYPELEEPFEKIMKQLGGNVKSYFMPEEYKAFAPYLNTLQSMKANKGIQARLPLNFQVD